MSCIMQITSVSTQYLIQCVFIVAFEILFDECFSGNGLFLLKHIIYNNYFKQCKAYRNKVVIKDSEIKKRMLMKYHS